MLALQPLKKPRLLAAGDLLMAGGLIVLAGFRTLPTVFASPSANVDIDAIGYASLALLPSVLAVGLLTLAAAAHWWNWSLRWLVQSLAIASLVGAVIAVRVFM